MRALRRPPFLLYGKALDIGCISNFENLLSRRSDALQILNRARTDS